MTDGSHYLAFETGGTKLVAAVAGPDLRILETVVLHREKSDRAERSFKRVAAAAEGLHRRYAANGAGFRAIGFGFGGVVRRSTNSPHLCLHEDGWEEIDVAGELNARFGLPAFVENDCKLAALAEAHCGAGAGASSVFYITLGTGVGGGLVREGRIQALGDFGEAEIGHVVVERGGPPCCCGGRGCVESVCSGPGLSHLAALLGERSPGLWRASKLFAPRPPDSKAILAAWRAGDPFGSLVVERSVDYLATALAAAVNLTVPEKVVIGGGLGTASARLIDLLRKRTAPLVAPYFRDDFEIVVSKLREQAVTQGAALMAARKIAARLQ